MIDQTRQEIARGAPEWAEFYVLGLLDTAEEAMVEDEIEQGGAMRAAVASARERFLPLDLSVPAAVPSADLWSRIDGQLDKEPAPSKAETGRQATARPAATVPPAANDNALSKWRLTALAGIAASLLLAVGLAFNLTASGLPAVIAVLVDDDGAPLALVEDFGDQSARVTPLSDIDVPDGRTMQVWTLPNEDLGPVSLGLLEENETTVLDDWGTLPEPRGDQLYEITFEPEGGSPTGRPTGDIVGKGLARQPR